MPVIFLPLSFILLSLSVILSVPVSNPHVLISYHPVLSWSVIFLSLSVILMSLSVILLSLSVILQSLSVILTIFVSSSFPCQLIPILVIYPYFLVSYTFFNVRYFPVCILLSLAVIFLFFLVIPPVLVNYLDYPCQILIYPCQLSSLSVKLQSLPGKLSSCPC